MSAAALELKIDIDKDQIDDARKWLDHKFAGVTDEYVLMEPTDWAETYRYISSVVSDEPGPFSYKDAPFFREIADSMGYDSSVRLTTLMKGVQLGGTTSCLETILGYYIAHLGNVSMMLLSADQSMAEQRLSKYIIPMLELSGMAGEVMSSSKNHRKTGQTSDSLEFRKGGWLLCRGARSANKLKSDSIRLLLCDEVDGYLDVVGNEGCPLAQAISRTAGRDEMRKIFILSTPKLEGSSKVAEHFYMGDQRYYHVPCVECGEKQVLRFNVTGENGERYGLIWDQDETGALVEGSTRYRCQNPECAHEHREADKREMFAEENGAEWRATAKAKNKWRRSYHLSSLYSPFMSWERCVEHWLDAWDTVNSRTKDVKALQKFYNHILGEPFKVEGRKVSFRQVSGHKRREFMKGEVPNLYAREHCGGPITMITAQVDVHKSNLAYSVWGWARGYKAFLIDYERIRDEDCRDIASPAWSTLKRKIMKRANGTPHYLGDDGLKYNIAATFVDAGYSTKTVYDFCSQFQSAVHPILGRPRTQVRGMGSFSIYSPKNGVTGYIINVDNYKDIMAPSLARDWTPAAGLQDDYTLNLPFDTSDEELTEMTKEWRVSTINKQGYETYLWHRPDGADNEAWDLWCYGLAMMDIIAYRVQVERYEMDRVDMNKWWDQLESDALYFSAA